MIALDRASGEHSGSEDRMPMPGVESASAMSQGMDTMASRWACRSAPFGMRWVIRHSSVSSMSSRAWWMGMSG